MVRPGDFPALQRVLWCGEVLPTPALMYWMERLPHVQFTNLYGPTETTIASSYYTVPAAPRDRAGVDSDRRGVRGRRAPRPRRRLHAAPAGEIGELYIGGVGLSPGYWRDPVRTDAVFVPIRDSLRHGSGRSTGAFTRPATSPDAAKTASSISSDAPTRKSRAAATASSSEKSKRR